MIAVATEVTARTRPNNGQDQDDSAAAEPATAKSSGLNSIDSEEDESQGPALGVAVINLDRVAAELNRVEPIQAELKAKKEELVSRLQLLNAGFQEEIGELQEKYGDAPTAEQRSQIEERQQEAIRSVEEAMKQGRNELSKLEQSLRREFQDEVRPIAYQIAVDAGFPVVMTSNQVFAYRVGSPQDITERVIKYMRVQSPSQPNAALPKLSTPPNKTR